jgi:TfoX/Sxy family transcriptional regulator of competence genes
MAYDETLASRIRALLASAPGFAEKKMFGGLCFLISGNMCCGVLKDELVVRLDAESAAELLHRPHTRPMDFTGRPLKGFVYVEPTALRGEAALRKWVSYSRAFASALPPRRAGKSRHSKTRSASKRIR